MLPGTHRQRWVGAILLVMAIPISARSARVEVGEPFPEIALPTLDGEIRSISDFRGQKVILHVFASW